VVRRIGGTLGLLLVLVLASVAALASPDSALAQTTTPFESLRAGNTTYLDDFYGKILHDSERSQGWNSSVSTASNSNKNVLYRQVTKARVGARLLPAAGWMTKLSVAGAAGYAGYLIYQHFSGGSREHETWIESAALGGAYLFNPCAAPPGGNCPPDMGWDGVEYGAQGGSSGTGLAFNSGYVNEVGAVWVLTYSSDNSNGGCSTAQGGPSPPCFVLHLNPYGYTAVADSRSHGWNCDGSGAYIYENFSSCWMDWGALDALGYPDPSSSQAGWVSTWPAQLWFAVDATKEAVVANTPGAQLVTTGTYAYASGSAPRTKVVISDEDMQTGTIFADDQGTPDQTSDYTLPSPYFTDPTGPGTTADTGAALDEFDSPCGQSFVNWVLEPGSYSFDADSCGGWTSVPTFPLVQPLVNETYADYLQRLRDMGWLGAATSTEVAPGDELPQMGPEGVTTVRIGQNVYRPTAWPRTAPRWNVNVNVTVTYNPASLPEAPGGGEPLPPGSGGGTGVPVPPDGPLGDWCEACPPVDFGPLTDADFGGSFPFGVVVWVGDFLGTLTTTADAPVFDFDYTETAAGSIGTYNLGHYAVDLEVLDPYMSVIRTILSWVIWIGGVWWFGSRLLGFRETGDPGGAVDDAW
jgi:hypothetical protein